MCAIEVVPQKNKEHYLIYSVVCCQSHMYCFLD